MRQLPGFLIFFFTFLLITTIYAQPNYGSQQRCKDEDIPRYTAHKIMKAPVVDGRLDEEAWKNATRSSRFADIISGSATHLDTRAAVLWDDEYLYVGYWVQEPYLTAKHTQRDAFIYEDNDVELFIAGPDGYYELEINSFGTIYEVLFFWLDNYEARGYNNLAGLNREASGAKVFNGVGYRHPRGARIGFWKWDMPGLKTAVYLQGTINNNTDTDKGWTVEIAIPWSSLQILARAGNRALPPTPKDAWRMDFSRFNTKKGNASDSGGWAWSTHGVWDSHVPECFTYIEFAE